MIADDNNRILLQGALLGMQAALDSDHEKSLTAA
jgi:hypothetical protein